MTVSHIFPSIRVRDDTPQKKPPRQPGIPRPRAGGVVKYDHWQMLQDKIAGMTWEEVAEKHGIVGTEKTDAGRLARGIAMNSAASYKLKPHEVGLLLRSDANR